MKITRRHWMLLTLALIFFCLVPYGRVHAYVDPGTGSYLLQLVLAALFGLLFTIRVFWAKIKSVFKQICGVSKKRGGQWSGE